MKRTSIAAFLVLVALSALIAVGCNNPPPQVQPTSPAVAPPPSMTGAPAGTGKTVANGPALTVDPAGQPLPGLNDFKGKKNPTPNDAATLAKAKDLFVTNCGPCHGPEGKGDGALVATIPEGQPKPRNFTSGEFKYGNEDWQVMRTVQEGVPGTLMAGWRIQAKFSEADAWALVHYVKSLSGQK